MDMGMDVEVEMDGKSIGDCIKEEICERNLTAYALGKMTGVSPVTIQRFLAGERGLTLATAEKLARALGLEVCRCDPAESPPEDRDGREDEGLHEGIRFFDLDPSTGLHIGDGVLIRVSNTNRGIARILIHAPPEATVSRGELVDQKGVDVEEHPVRVGTQRRPGRNERGD
jgi:transcriptional regulator with XRE-family HTH domain